MEKRQYIIVIPKGWPDGNERTILFNDDMYARDIYWSMRDNVRGADSQILVSAGYFKIKDGVITCFGELTHLEKKPSRGEVDSIIISRFLGFTTFPFHSSSSIQSSLH